MKNLSIVLLLFCILSLAFFLGSRMIISGDFLYLYDQVREMILVRDIVVLKKLTLIGTHSGVGGLFHGPLWLYSLIPFFILGGGNPLVFSYAYILLSLVIVFSGFVIVTKLYNKELGLLAAFFLAISPRIWGYVLFTHGVNVAPLVYIALFYFFIKYIRGNKSAFIGIAFFTGLTLQFETASAILLITFIPFFYLFTQILLLWKKKDTQKNSSLKLFLQKEIQKQSKVIILSIIAFLTSIANFILFDLRHDFLTVRSFFAFLVNHKQEKGYLTFPERFYDHLNSLKEVYVSFIHTQNSVLEIFLVCIVGFAIYRLFKKKISFDLLKEWIFCGLFPVCIFVLFLVYPYTIYPEYVLGLTISVIFFVMLTVMIVWPTKIGKMLILVFVALNLLYALNSIQHQYREPFPKNGTSGSYQNQKAVADWVFKDSLKKPFGYFVYTPETFTYGMDYLFWWLGTKKYGYVPKSEKISQTYLILYPGLIGDKEAHSFWKKNTIKTVAKIQHQTVFLGNITVEKFSALPHEEPVDPNYYQNLIFR